MNKDRACFFINIIRKRTQKLLTNEQWTRVRIYFSPLVFFLIIGGTEQQEHWETRVVFFTLYSNIIKYPCSVLRHVAVIEVSSLSTTSTSYPCSSTGLSLCPPCCNHEKRAADPFLFRIGLPAFDFYLFSTFLLYFIVLLSVFYFSPRNGLRSISICSLLL